jgi:cobyrinic acid a,c-diamide synthase
VQRERTKQTPLAPLLVLVTDGGSNDAGAAASLTTVDGNTHAIAGLLPVAVTMQDQYRALDHVAFEATTDTLIAATGDRLRGHEFHYSSADTGQDASFAFDIRRGTGIDGEHDGVVEYATLGTYSHVHAESGAFDAFLESLIQ